MKYEERMSRKARKEKGRIRRGKKNKEEYEGRRKENKKKEK